MPTALDALPGIDLAALMRMGRKVYTRTFSKTDDVDLAAELIAADMDALERSGRAPTGRNALTPRNLLVWLWAGRWAGAAFPLV